MRFVEQTVNPGGRLLCHRFACWLLHGWRHWRIERYKDGIMYECVKCNWRWLKGVKLSPYKVEQWGG